MLNRFDEIISDYIASGLLLDNDVNINQEDFVKRSINYDAQLLLSVLDFTALILRQGYNTDMYNSVEVNQLFLENIASNLKKPCIYQVTIESFVG